jgi:HK97 family phage prohead protease
MPIKDNRLYRAFTDFTFTEMRSEAEGKAALILRGKPIVFNTPTVIYECERTKYIEIIARNAFEEADMSDFIFNFNHSGRVYARTKNKSLTYSVTDRGFECVATLSGEDEGHRQLYRDVDSGLLDKMSFSFIIAPGGAEYKEEYGVCTRTITKVKKLYDVSVVSFPAYEETSIATRSAFSEEFKKELAAVEYRRQCLYAQALTY